MGNFLRLVVFIVLLGGLAAGTATLLLRERRSGQALERAFAEAGPDALAALRRSHTDGTRALLLLSGLALASLTVLALIPARPGRSAPAGDAAAVRSEMRGLESLARATNAQRVELDHEREARHRSEQDLHLQQVLANQALQDKIRLGRDLHDGLVQTLYATGLVLETAARRLAIEPVDTAEAAQLLERAKTTLNAAIREARGTIGDLTPDALEEQSFPEAVHAILSHLDVGRLRERDIRLDPTLPAFAEPMRTELLQIIRETVSNAVRHGDATRLELDFAPLPDGRLRLALRDDGRGFDPAAVTRGHGLDNLSARARNLRAELVLDSAPGRGTALTLTLPAPAADRAA
jgi:signal transduction histidine kinase